MSYLDTPRLHFAGGFAADPSTVNNRRVHHDPQVPITDALWNPKGNHDFSLQGCTVRSTVDASGVVRQAAADDALVGGSVVAGPAGKLVDLDPAFQAGSQVWGLGLRVSAGSGGGRVRGRMTTATMRDLWFRRGPEGFSKGVGASYQSVLTDLRWEPGSGSPVLEELRRVSPERLSVKFVAYAYDFMGSKTGRIVGTIGPVQPGEPDHFLAARRVSADPGAALGSPASREAAFGAVPFKLDPARNMIVLDLGNAVPEQSGGGEPRQLGTMQAVILSPRETLGAIDYSKAHYELTAGVNELAITREQAQRLAGAPLGITVSTQGGDPVMTERPSGLYVDATETVWRMDPDTTESVELVATRFGAPLDNHPLSLAVLSGTPASALTLPDPPRVTTDAGQATVAFTAGDPGHPREEHLDGQYYQVGFFDGETTDPSRLLGGLHIRVFDRHPEVADPTWTDVQPVFAAFDRLYPSMQEVFDLGVEAAVREHLEGIGERLNLAPEDRRYMPVTRDLSRDKLALVLRWLDRGAP
jgi:hypothetical protein